jgi:hypothetical protein
MAKKNSKKGDSNSPDVKNGTENATDSTSTPSEPKDSNDYVKNESIDFPSDAPIPESNGNTQDSGPVNDLEQAFPNEPADAPVNEEIIAEAVVEAIAEVAIEVIEEIVEENKEVVEPTSPNIEKKKPASPAAPKTREQTLEDREEMALEKWWNIHNKPASINHFELAYSNSGVNLDRFGMLEAKVGKFRFRRTYVGANWDITIEEK